MSDKCPTFRNLAIPGDDGGWGALLQAGVAFPMGAIEVGIRELQRRTADTLARVDEDGCCAIVSRHGRPVAVLVPISQALPWVLLNRPPADESELLEDEAFWPLDDGVRVAPSAMGPLEELPEQARRRLMTSLRKLRGLDATGRIAIRAGFWWAVADLDGASDVPTLLRIARRAELERWLPAAAAAEPAAQPM
jgi:prevent-host-death family protein